jgi:hypothetical protein
MRGKEVLDADQLERSSRRRPRTWKSELDAMLESRMLESYKGPDRRRVDERATSEVHDDHCGQPRGFELLAQLSMCAQIVVADQRQKRRMSRELSKLHTWTVGIHATNAPTVLEPGGTPPAQVSCATGAQDVTVQSRAPAA